MHFTYDYKGITWINLEKPTRDEARKLMEEYDLHPLIAEELLQPSLRPKVDLHNNCLYLILHFPDTSNSEADFQEIDFIVGKDFIITSHYNDVDPLHTFSKMFEVNSILDKSQLGNHAGFILYYMLRDMYRNLSLELVELDKDLEYIESKIFAGDEHRMVKKISLLNRKILDIRKSLRFHDSVLESLEESAEAFFNNGFRYYMHSVTNEYMKVNQVVQGQKELLDDLRSTNDSLLTNRTNDIMKALTIIAFTVTPLNLATQLLAMNTEVSFLQNVTDGPFFIILGLTSLVALGLFYFFKKRRWI